MLLFDFLQLFFSDPSGMFVRYKCKAIGSGSEGAQSTLQEGYSDSLTLAEAEALAVSTLKQVCLCGYSEKCYFRVVYIAIVLLLAFFSLSVAIRPRDSEKYLFHPTIHL